MSDKQLWTDDDVDAGTLQERIELLQADNERLDAACEDFQLQIMSRIDYAESVEQLYEEEMDKVAALQAQVASLEATLAEVRVIIKRVDDYGYAWDDLEQLLFGEIDEEDDEEAADE